MVRRLLLGRNAQPDMVRIEVRRHGLGSFLVEEPGAILSRRQGGVNRAI